MVKIVRTGNVIQKFSKDGKILSGSSFRTVEDAKKFEKLYNKCIEKKIPFDVGMKIKSKYLKRL